MPLTRRPPRPASAEASAARSPRTGAPFADRRLTAQAGVALLVANARYWGAVAPLVRAQLSRWERRAGEIPDPLLQTLARRKLREERFNVEVAATLATLAPRAQRRGAVEAIVALQVMYDYLDLLTEQPSPDPLADGRRLHGALRDALTPGAIPEGRNHHRRHPRSGDGGYLRELSETVRLALAQLPAAGAVAEVALCAGERCAEAQALSHAAARAEREARDRAVAELERWARREAAGTALQWPEYLAGATASVLAVHALIAAAADRHTTRADAQALDTVYLSIGALTMLDSLVDQREDRETGELGYLRCYESPERMAQRLASVAAEAVSGARALPGAGHHVMTVVGVVAYYISAPAARGAPARPVAERLRAELRPLIAPTLALMRAWRAAKLARRALHAEDASARGGP
jgi:tetraprenyl-beta-curcumene synthase